MNVTGFKNAQIITCSVSPEYKLHGFDKDAFYNVYWLAHNEEKNNIIVRNLKFATYLKFTIYESFNKINEFR